MNDFEHLPVLNTPNLILRKFTESDVSEWFSVMDSEHVQKFLGGMVFTYEDCEKFIQKQIRNYQFNKKVSYAIVLKNENKLIGNVVLSIDQENNCAELSYVIHENYWGKGYATECSEAVIAFGFEVLQLNRIEANSIAENIASCKVLLKLHMQFEGTSKNSAYVSALGKFNDFNFYSILKNEYDNLKNNFIS